MLPVGIRQRHVAFGIVAQAPDVQIASIYILVKVQGVADAVVLGWVV